MTTIAGDPMKYYGSWTSIKLDYMQLLANKDSQCTGWSSYFIDVLRIQGLDYKMYGITVNRDTLKEKVYDKLSDVPFLVQNWDNQGVKRDFYYNSINTSAAVGYRTAGLTAHQKDGKWVYNFSSNVSELKYAGGKAQNNDNPVASFVNHEVVRIGDDIYDPSYGKIYTAEGGGIDGALKKFQTAAIFGYYKFIPMSGKVLDGKKVRVPAGLAVIQVEAADPGKLQLKIEKVTKPILGYFPGK